jgi:hypothetical protein
MFKDITVSNTIMEEFKDCILTSGVRKNIYLCMEVVKLQEKDLITELILMLKNVKLCNSLKETYVLKTLSLLLVLKSL